MIMSSSNLILIQRLEDVVERKIEKYIEYFVSQPRFQGYNHTLVTKDLEKLKQYNLQTQSSTWITR
jgi:hypothetical protein